MAEKEKTDVREEKKKEEKPRREENKKEESRENVSSIIRIMSTDVPGNKKLAYGLTRIKGVSYSFANAVCNSLKMDKNKRVSELTEEEIKKITDFIKDPNLPVFMFNRRRDYETGKNMHLTLTNLELQKEFDIKRLRKIKSYRGWRHALGLPVRGQRTKSHFRHGKSVGVQKIKSKPATGEKTKEKFK